VRVIPQTDGVKRSLPKAPPSIVRDDHGHYAGIDVSLEASSVCVVEASGKIVRETKVSSEPEDLIAWFKALPFVLVHSLSAQDQPRRQSLAKQTDAFRALDRHRLS
jgi:hypothetical protein